MKKVYSLTILTGIIVSMMQITPSFAATSSPSSPSSPSLPAPALSFVAPKSFTMVETTFQEPSGVFKAVGWKTNIGVILPNWHDVQAIPTYKEGQGTRIAFCDAYILENTVPQDNVPIGQTVYRLKSGVYQYPNHQIKKFTGYWQYSGIINSMYTFKRQTSIGVYSFYF